MAELTPKEAAEILGVARNRQWADLRRESPEPADHYLAGWRRCADAMLNAAVKDLGPGTEAAAPFRAALIALRGSEYT